MVIAPMPMRDRSSTHERPHSGRAPRNRELIAIVVDYALRDAYRARKTFPSAEKRSSDDANARSANPLIGCRLFACERIRAELAAMRK